MNDAWEYWKISEDKKEIRLIAIFKKGNKRDSSKYHEFPFLSIPGKVFAHILLNR